MKGVDSGAVAMGVSVTNLIGVGVTCAVGAASEPTGSRSVVWVGEMGPPGRLQAESTAMSVSSIHRNLSVFNFAFMIAMKSYFRAMRVYCFSSYTETPQPHPSAGEFVSSPLGGDGHI